MDCRKCSYDYWVRHGKCLPCGFDGEVNTGSSPLELRHEREMRERGRRLIERARKHRLLVRHAVVGALVALSLGALAAFASGLHRWFFTVSEMLAAGTASGGALWSLGVELPLLAAAGAVAGMVVSSRRYGLIGGVLAGGVVFATSAALANATGVALSGAHWTATLSGSGPAIVIGAAVGALVSLDAEAGAY